MIRPTRWGGDIIGWWIQKERAVLPVRPDLMAEVLGVGPINSDLLKEPFPVVRFNNDQRAYMLTWQVLLSDRWVVQKEVWYDVQTLFTPIGCCYLIRTDAWYCELICQDIAKYRVMNRFCRWRRSMICFFPNRVQLF
ncbi:MAG: hypothetical protein KatS3mg104_0311 [Phycisphaerae bacterium]|nr:MAG: hypothetical protein KatS3mg104_0311 [Phycisphaerae bacterium]